MAELDPRLDFTAPKLPAHMRAALAAALVALPDHLQEGFEALPREDNMS